MLLEIFISKINSTYYILVVTSHDDYLFDNCHQMSYKLNLGKKVEIQPT